MMQHAPNFSWESTACIFVLFSTWSLARKFSVLASAARFQSAAFTELGLKPSPSWVRTKVVVERQASHRAYQDCLQFYTCPLGYCGSLSLLEKKNFPAMIYLVIGMKHFPIICNKTNIIILICLFAWSMMNIYLKSMVPKCCFFI